AVRTEPTWAGATEGEHDRTPYASKRGSIPARAASMSGLTHDAATRERVADSPRRQPFASRRFSPRCETNPSTAREPPRTSTLGRPEPRNAQNRCNAKLRSCQRRQKGDHGSGAGGTWIGREAHVDRGGC